MNDMNVDERLFFAGRESAIPLYASLKQKILVHFPHTQTEAKKTQINFKNKHLFACVSFQRVLKKSMLPDPYMVLTIGMPYPLDSERVAVKTEPYPGRWTTHIVLGTVDEIDEELMAWLSDAYAFAEIK